MKTIKLSNQLNTIVDDEDFEYLSQWKWAIGGRGYALCNYPIAKNKYKTVKMHRLIMNAPKGIEVDHINGDKLDNRRSNLRLATRNENAKNRSLNSNSKSGLKGVYWKKDANKWRAEIAFEGKSHYLGIFTDKLIAAKAYNEAAKKYHGEFARLNGGLQ